MKKLLFLALCLSAAVLAAGCDITGKDSSEETPFNENSYTTDSIAEKKSEYSWILKPSIAADNIISFDSSQIDPDDELNHAYANYAVIRNGGKYGLIDYSGSIVIEPEYDDYYTCWCGEIALVNYIDQRKGLYEYCSVDSSNQVVNFTPNHTDNAPVYYWAKNKVYVKNKNEEFAHLYDGKKTVVVGEAAVKDEGNGNFSVEPKKNTLYGLAKKDKLIGKIEYTDYYAPTYKGAGLTCIALKNSEEKWGFVNSSGKTVIDFKCDGDDNAYGGFLIDDAARSHPYLFSGEYVPISIEGSYYYYNKSGECVVNAGEFEQARPVHNGRAWVKKDGLWGVIQLGEIISEESSAADSQTQTSQQTQWTDYNYNQQTWEYTQDFQTQEQTDPPVPTEAQTLPPETTTIMQTEPSETAPPVTDPPITDPPQQPIQPADTAAQTAQSDQVGGTEQNTDVQ